MLRDDCDGVMELREMGWDLVFILQDAEQEIGGVCGRNGRDFGGGGWMKRWSRDKRGENLVKLHFVYVYMRGESGDKEGKFHHSVGG